MIAGRIVMCSATIFGEGLMVLFPLEDRATFQVLDLCRIAEGNMNYHNFTNAIKT